MTIASLLQQRHTITQIAQRPKRSAGTISREFKRNAQEGCYAIQVATICARQRRRSGRPAKKLHAEGILFGVVHHFLNQRWSPEQIELTLASIYPKGHELRELREGFIAAAATDLFRDEQTGRANSPLIRLYAASQGQLLVTPHIAGASWDSMAKSEDFIISKLLNECSNDAVL